jgi:putative salt-induced outer membrane protein YdiY
MRTRLTPFAVAALLAAAVFAPALAQDPPPAPEKPKLGWSNQGEVAWTLTSGNANMSTISLANTLDYRWPNSLLSFYAFGIRATTDDTLRFEDADTGAISEREISTTNAERYVLALNFEDKISARLFWFAAGGWERNPPSGIDSRLLLGGGVGNIWYENDRGHFRTSYGINYTWESWTNGTNENFLGGNLRADWLWKFSDNASFQTVNTLFPNFSTWNAWRINSNNSLTVQMSKMLALKVGLTFLYDNQPQDGVFPVFGASGGQVGTVEEPLDELDTIFTTALVIGF